MLSLDSAVVQVVGKGSNLAVSTMTRVVVADTAQRTFHEVGTKLRQGCQGVALAGGRIWAARPGCRLWEVDSVTGMVLSTRQFRPALGELPPSRLHAWRVEGTREIGGEHGFGLLVAGEQGRLLTWSTSGRLYVLDTKVSGLAAWATLAPARVAGAALKGNTIALLDTNGRLRSLTQGTLVQLLERAVKLDKPEVWAELLLLNRSTVKGLGREDLVRVAATR